MIQVDRLFLVDREGPQVLVILVHLVVQEVPKYIVSVMDINESIERQNRRNTKIYQKSLPVHHPFQKLLQGPEHLEYPSFLVVPMHPETLFLLSRLPFQVHRLLLSDQYSLSLLENHLYLVVQVNQATHFHL